MMRTFDKKNLQKTPPSLTEINNTLSLSLHRHSYIGFILAFASSIHSKQHSRLLTLSMSLGVPVPRPTQCIRDV
jgi:hypothetical protein